jgi:8-oxo-dGTP pyrophosphatase MutT (NUDIX family)
MVQEGDESKILMTLPVDIKKVFETEWFSIEEVRYHPSDANPYYRLCSEDSVVVIALTPQKEMILVRQFRPAIGDYTLELPAGNIIKGETVPEAAHREFTEETGYDSAHLEPVGSYRVAPDRINSMAHVFFMKDARISQKNMRNSNEETEVVLASEEKFHEMIRKKEPLTISTIATYYLLKMRGLF